MELNWSLDKLYTGFDSEKFKNDIESLKNEINDLDSFAKSNLRNLDEPVKKIEEYISRNQKIMNFSILQQYTFLVLSVDSLNDKALKISDNLDEIYTGLSYSSVLFTEFIGKLENLDEIIKDSALLEEHSFILRNTKEEFKYTLSDKEELVLAKLRSTGSSAWESLHGQLTANLMIPIEIDGKEERRPLSVIRSLAHDKDSEVRKKAYEAELKGYEQIDKSIAFALIGIKGEVLTTSKMRGYESPLDMTLKNSYMDKETLDAMLSAMVDSLPMFEKYFRKKAEKLGHKNGLPFYDLFAPLGEVHMKFDFEEAKSFVLKNFYEFSQKLGDFAKQAFEENWIDVLPHEGKVGGAFCDGLHPIKECRILLNFAGKFEDVLTLAHELGHGYHGACLYDESILNSDYPMPIAETASNFCEQIVTQATYARASEEEKLVILEQSISDCSQVVVDIYSRFLFESKVFETRVDGSLSVNELKEFMTDAQKTAFGSGLDHAVLHPYMWVCKGHYYHASTNFYNFPYAYGMLFAKGLYAKYLEDKSGFVAKYDELLNATGKNTLRDVGLIVGIDVRDKEFWASSFKLIEKDIETFIK